MTRMIVPALLLCLFATVAHASETKRLYLKSGDFLDVKILNVDEEGLKVDLDGIELFIRWTFTRGDRHYDLRREATDFRDIPSLMRLADFCHEFAIDDEQYRVLAIVLRIDPSHYVARERIRQLPVVEGEDVPDPSPADPTDPAPSDPAPSDPTPAEPATPEVTRQRVLIVSEDEEAVEWAKREFGRLDFDVVDGTEYDVRLVLDVKLELIENPRFMGADVFAVYKGELRWRLYRKGQDRTVEDRTVKVDRVRRDSRLEAQNRCRANLLEDATPSIVSALQDMR